MNLFKRISLYILLFSLIVPPTHLHAGKGNGFALAAGSSAAISYLSAAGLTVALGPVGLLVASGATVVGFAGLIAHNKKKYKGNSATVPQVPSKGGGGGGSFGGNNDDDKNRKIWEQIPAIEKAQKDLEFNKAQEVAATKPETPVRPATPVVPAPEMPAAKPTPANSTETVLGSAPDLRTGVNKALETLGPQDKTGSLPIVGKLGATKNLIAGRVWSTNNIRSSMRLDYSPKQGLHINVEGFNHATKKPINGIIQVPGNAQTLSNYLKHLNTPASMAAGLNALKLAASSAKSGAQYAANMATRLSSSLQAIDKRSLGKLFNAAAQTARWLLDHNGIF